MKTKHYTVPASASGEIKVDASQGPVVVELPNNLRKITITKVDDSDNEVVVRTDGRETIVFGD